MVCLLGKTAAENFVGILNGHKGEWIVVADDFFDARDLGQFNDAEENLTFMMSVGTFCVDVGNAAVDGLHDGFGNLFIFLADDEDVFLVVEAISKGIADFGHEEIGYQCIQGRFNAEEKSFQAEQDRIDGKAGRTDFNGIKFLYNSSDDIRSARTAADPVQDSKPHAVQRTGCDAGEHRILDDFGRVEKGKDMQEEGKTECAVNTADEVTAAH